MVFSFSEEEHKNKALRNGIQEDKVKTQLSTVNKKDKEKFLKEVKASANHTGMSLSNADTTKSIPIPPLATSKISFQNHQTGPVKEPANAGTMKEGTVTRNLVIVLMGKSKSSATGMLEVPRLMPLQFKGSENVPTGVLTTSQSNPDVKETSIYREDKCGKQLKVDR